jgi:hypothetical protein
MTRRPAPARKLRVLAPVAGPLLIVSSVVVVLHAFVFGGKVSDQHPDILAFWMPTYCFLGKSLAAGHIPAWNPFALAGAPFAADPQSGWMYLPAMALFTAFPCQLAIRLMIVLQPVLAGLGIYWFLRSEGLSRPAATTGGLALALALTASRLVLFLPFPSSMAWTALLLAACSRTLRAGNWPARLLWCGLTAATWGQLAASHAGHGLIIGSAALLSYLVAKTVSKIRNGEWTLSRAGTMLGLLASSTALINLAYLLPRLSYLHRSSYGTGFSQLRQITGLAPSWPLKLSTTPGAYLGAATLALSLAGWRSKRHRVLLAAIGTFGAASYLVALRYVTPSLANALRSVPLLGFYQHYPARFGLGLVIALPILAGIGMEAWREASSNRERLLMLAPGLAMWFLLPPILGASFGHLALPVAGSVAGGLALAAAVRRPVLLILVPAVLAVELGVNGIAGQSGTPSAADSSQDDVLGSTTGGWLSPLLYPTIDGSAYVSADSIVAAMGDGQDRFMSLDTKILTGRGYLTKQDPPYWGLLANQRSMLFGLQDVQGYNPFQPARYWTYVRTIVGRSIDYNAAFFSDPSAAALDLLQVGWIVGPHGMQPVAGAVEVARDGAWSLYRLAEVAPRAQFFAGWRTVDGAPAALSAVTAQGFDPSREVVLERDPGLGPPGSVAAGSGSATYDSLGNQAARIQVTSSVPGVLLVRNAFDRGWQATIDGVSVPVLAADYLAQGIPVPAGTHEILLTYDDPTIGYGLLGSGLALALLVGAALALRGSAGRGEAWVDRGSSQPPAEAARV